MENIRGPQPTHSQDNGPEEAVSFLPALACGTRTGRGCISLAGYQEMTLVPPMREDRQLVLTSMGGPPNPERGSMTLHLGLFDFIYPIVWCTGTRSSMMAPFLQSVLATIWIPVQISLEQTSRVLYMSMLHDPLITTVLNSHPFPGCHPLAWLLLICCVLMSVKPEALELDGLSMYAVRRLGPVKDG